jgi:hypothetical protein
MEVSCEKTSPCERDALSCRALPLHAQNLWSAKFSAFGNFVKAGNLNANGVLSEFTPATGITINRVQLSSAAGGLGCNPLPSIRITDGTTSIFLAIPNSTATNQFNPVSNDTGPISDGFPAGAKLRMIVVPGGCASYQDYPWETGVNVQYSTN